MLAMPKPILLALLFLAALLAPLHRGSKAVADEQVDLLLVLAADISRSVDAQKFKLQREGYAAALTNPKVVDAIRSVPSGRIAICFVEWSGLSAQAVVVDWAVVGSASEAKAFADRILEAPRQFMERTAIGSAIDYSVAQIERSPFKASRHVIDVSGDGTSNSGRSVVEARDAAVAKGITINGLAILSEVPLPSNPTHTHPPGGLLKYYQDNVIGGIGAFALAADGHEAFGQLIINKLIKEIAMGPSASTVR